MKIKKREVIIGIFCLLLGLLVSYLTTRSQIESNKGLTKRILSNAIQSMEASKEMADSCAEAYNTATICVANLRTCNIEEETKKLDEFNTRRKHADTQIDWMGKDMQRIIKEVSASR
jgi:hypothetical protein